MSNQLAQETSPYLLQHKDNPVDWYPWGDQAIAKARQEEKPIFLSIGYSACHWCHVMEHESFENKAIADVLNAHFVSIKVDREERPDLDQIYMNAVQMLTGHGGWPMSLFLTPDLKPFYGGTYWPPQASRGMPGFDQILAAIHQAWQERREQAIEGAEHLTQQLHKVGLSDSESLDRQPSRDLVDDAATQMRRAHDPAYGGFGSAPKFPQAMALQLLLRHWKRSGQKSSLEVVRLTLDHMASGGIYDHLGGGFSRYSVDARWLVPHFEKMLYDNALLGGAYLDAYLATGEKAYEHVVREILNYVLRDMTDPAGGFYSTEDADSEGSEGLYYTWTPDEIKAVLGSEKAVTFSRVYGVSEEGNFEGRNILHLARTIEQSARVLDRDEHELHEELAESRAKLLAARAARVRPERDDKVLVAWNGLMIDTLARAGAALAEESYIKAAEAAARFLSSKLRRDDGRLLHTWRNGFAKLDAYLDDYACLADGLISLYEATFDEHWLAESVALIDVLLSKFADHESGGFFFTAIDHETLIARTKDFTDASTPSGNGVAATALLRLGKLLGRSDYLDAVAATLNSGANLLQQAPLATGQLLLALDLNLGPAFELVLAGDLESDPVRQVVRDIHSHYLPNCLLAACDPGDTSPQLLGDVFAGKEAIGGQPTLYVCENFACREPTVGSDQIKLRLAELAASP
jgi:hypothetical protein